MIDAIQKKEEQEERRHEQGRRLPLYAPPPPEMPEEEEEEEEPPRGSAIIDYRLAKEAKTVRATKRKLHQIIREEKAKILKEIKPDLRNPTYSDAGDQALQQALELFPDALVDDHDGEIYIDTGLDDASVEAMYDRWMGVWPDAIHEEGGLIYTGIMI